MAKYALPFGCSTLFRSLSQFLQLTPLLPSVPCSGCSKAVSRHTKALHSIATACGTPPVGATCAAARSCWFSAAAHSRSAIASKPTLRSCALPVFNGHYGGQLAAPCSFLTLSQPASGQLWRSRWRTLHTTVPQQWLTLQCQRFIAAPLVVFRCHISVVAEII